MSDFPSSLPPAGWYPDPSNPASERWWGGLEWTESTRPLPVLVEAPPATAPAYAMSVPGGGVNPFAEVLRQERLAAVGASSGGFGSFEASKGPAAFTGFDASGGVGGSTVAASWYENPRVAMGPPPENPMATAGLILSIVGVQLLGLIFSIIALKKARAFVRQGMLPVGRKRARWGLTLAILTYVVIGAATAVALPIYLEQKLDAAYDRAEYEELIMNSFAQAGAQPDSVTCPDEGSLAPGSSFSCEMVLDGTPHVIQFTFTDNIGGLTMSIDGQVVPT